MSTSNELPWLDGYDLEKLNRLYKQYEPIKETSDEKYRSYFEFAKRGYENFEIFLKHKNLIDEFLVSNFGNIRYNGLIIPSNLVMKGPNKGISNGDYDYYNEILFPNLPIRRYIFKTYRLVAEVWCNNPDPIHYTIVHHIGNDSFDNKSNLLFTTSSQHFSINHFSDKKKNELEKIKRMI